MLSSYIGWRLLIQDPFMPPWLGGKGSPFTLLQDGGHQDHYTWGMHAFYVIQFGKHSARLIQHLFIRSEGNFYEYALHHGLAVFLLTFSYLANLWSFGIFVLFVHDSSDFFLSLARLLKDYRHMNQLLHLIISAFTLFMWLLMRVVAYNYCCVFTSIYQTFNKIHTLPQTDRQVLTYPYYFLTFMITCLSLLNLFWTYYILESIILARISKKVKESYD